MGFNTGMGSALGTGVTSYYLHNADNVPQPVACDYGQIMGSSSTGFYNIAYNLGTETGALVIVFDVAYADDTSGETGIERGMPDKCVWKYKDTYGSEYSACHMGDGDNGSTNTMMGMGYMRGMIGASHNLSPGIDSIAVSSVVGSQLTSSSAPTDVDVLSSGYTSIGATYPLFNATTASNASVTHGIRQGMNQYDFINPSYTQNSLPPTFLGPYTGMNITEVADSRGNTFIGSSAVTLSNDVHACRQAMMVVPIVDGGELSIVVEAPFDGTWHRVLAFCQKALPKWGNADNKVGVKSDGNPYDDFTDASRHNFALPNEPTAGSLAGANTTKYHVNSQNSIYRIEDEAGGHVLNLSATAASGDDYEGVVNNNDWVFDDANGANRTAVGYYAIRINTTNYVVYVGAHRHSYITGNSSTNIPTAGIVKTIAAI